MIVFSVFVYKHVLVQLCSFSNEMNEREKPDNYCIINVLMSLPTIGSKQSKNKISRRIKDADL